MIAGVGGDHSREEVLLDKRGLAYSRPARGGLQNPGIDRPGPRWTIKDILVSGDQITVRGEAAGTPERDLFGAKPTGKSFKTMSIDVFTLKAGKLASAYHVENWVGALQQIAR